MAANVTYRSRCAHWRAWAGPLWHADGSDVELGGELERRVLTALAVRGEGVVTVDELADAVFGGDVTANAAVRLQNHVSRLRKRLGATAIVTDGSGYRLADECDIDWVRFERLVSVPATTADAVIDSRAQALALWHGRPFAALGDWPTAQAAAARLEELHRIAQEDYAAAQICHGRSAEAVGELERLVAEDPLRERRWALLMLAAYRCGRQAEALRAFDRARRVLADEAGLSPGPELVELQRRILAQDPDLAVPPAAAAVPPEPSPSRRRMCLPTPADSFIGRDQELDEIAAALDTHRLVTIVGAGGMGKTRLALEVASRANGFTDGVWLVELATVRADTDVAEAIAAALALERSPGTTVADQVVQWCARLDTMVILDTCEHVLDGVARLVARILASRPTVRLLATSREQMALAGEHVVPMGPLGLDAAVDGPSDAVRLLVERARSNRHDFDPTADAEILVEICERLDGMPLAIELAAVRLRALAPRALAERLNERLGILIRGRRDAAERHKTLRATVEWSYDLLSAPDRRLFDRLAVFTGPFGLDDAIALGGPPLPGSEASPDLDIVDCLAELVDRNLVVTTTTDPPYRMLETLRSYGFERLHAAGIADDVGGLHARWFRNKARAARAHMYGPAESSAARAAIAQVSDYVAAAEWALAHDQHDLAVDIPATLFEASFFRISRQLASSLNPLLGRLRAESKPSRGRLAWMFAGHLQFDAGDLDAAQHVITDALRLTPTSALCWAQSAIQAFLTGATDRVVHDATRCFDLAGDDVPARLAGYVLLGSAHVVVGQLDDARRIATEFLEWSQRIGSPTAIGFALHLQGRIDTDELPDRAMAEFTEALQFAREGGSQALELDVRREIVSLLMRMDSAEALPSLLDVLRRYRDEHNVAEAVGTLAFAVTILAQHGDPVTAATILGNLRAPLQSTRESERRAQSARELRESLGDRFDEITARGARMDLWTLLDLTISALADAAAAATAAAGSS